MYYFGVYLNPAPSMPSAYALIDKQLKNLKKEYRILDLNEFPSSATLSEVEEKIIAIYNDRALLTIKKRFSQDRRPSKKVAVFPTIVCGVEEAAGNPFAETRKKEIPVERLIFSNAPEEEPAKRELTLGADTYVPREAVFQAYLTVVSQGRLQGAREFLGASFPDQALGPVPAQSDGKAMEHIPAFPCLMALSAPLWFAETVRKISRY